MADEGAAAGGATTRASGGTADVVLEVCPQECLHDVRTDIRVSGLTPHTSCTLRMDTHNDQGKKFSSHAHYVSDDRGRVDVATSEAVGGSYSGVFPAGLFLTLQENPDDRNRMFKDDPTTPWQMELTVFEGHLTLEEAGEASVARAVLYRHLMGPGVRRIPVRHGRVRGALFLPQGAGPFPGLVDLFGIVRGLREYRAAMLASRGFASLALSYCNYDDLPENLEVLELEYFEEAMEFLLSQPEVIPDRCGVVSSSKGSDSALAMGVHLDKVTAVVCIGGSVIASMNDLTYRGRELWKGFKTTDDFVAFDHMNRLSYKEGAMRDILRHDNPLIVPVETASEDTHFLMVAGDQDTCQSKYGVEAISQRLKMYGRADKVHTIVYPGAGHIIEPPYNTLCEHSHYQLNDEKFKDLVIYWGGEARAQCDAEEDLWHQLRSFLAHHVRDCSHWYQDLLQKSRTKTDVA